MNAATPIFAPRRTKWHRHAVSGWKAVVILTLLVIITRMPALLAPKALDDEQVYAVVGTEMVHGGRPYQDGVERKPPLLFELYEGIFRLGGLYNWRALHLAMVLWTLATMALLYLAARHFGTPATGFWAAFLYAVFATWGDYRNLALNGELLMNLPVAGAVAVAFAPSRGRWRPELLLAGALVVVAFLLKQPSGITALAIGLYLLLPAYRRQRGIGWAESLVHGAVLTAGFLAAFLVTGLWLRREGILEAAIYWTVLNHGVPLGPGTWRFWRGLLSSTAFFSLSTLPLLLAAWASVVHRTDELHFWRGHRAELQGALLLLAVSLLGVAASGQFLYHYYLQLLVPLALLAAPVFARLWSAPAPIRSAVLRRAVLVPWTGAAAALFLVVNSVGVWQHRRPGAAGEWVRQHSAPEERMFVWGQGVRFTGLYLDARRRPASRYIASYPLTGHIFGVWDMRVNTSERIVPGAWDSLKVDFARHPPEYIIDTDGLTQAPAYPIARYPFLQDLLSREYREVHRARDGVVYERLGRPPASPGDG